MNARPERSQRRVLRPRNVSLGLAAFLALGLAYSGRDTSGAFDARRGELAEVELEERTVAGEHVTERVRLTSTSGLVVELALKYPLDSGVGRPLVVMLCGVHSGRDAVDLVDTTRDAVVAALNYPYYGPTKLKGLAVVPEIPAIRAAIRDTAPAAMLALDWLLEREDIDPLRVELVGVSAGASFACLVGGFDERFRRVWSIHGAADLPRLFAHNLRHRIPSEPLRVLTAHAAAFLAVGYSFHPEDWAARIAPRPFVMINALDDERLPRDCVERLFAAAAEPKELEWLEGAHVHPERTDVVRALVESVLDRMESDPLGRE
jgi:dienelactone hydrolase